MGAAPNQQPRRKGNRSTASPRQAGGRRPAGASRQPAQARRQGSRGASRYGGARRPSVTVVGGLLWGVVILAATGAAAPVAAVVMIPVAAVAAASGLRAIERGRGRQKRNRRTRPAGAVVAIGGAVVAPLAALAGPVPALVALGVVAVAVLAVDAQAPRSGPATRPASGQLGPRAARLVTVVGPTLAATSVVLARQQSASGALALIFATLAFDAGALMMGNTRTALGGPVGLVFGLVSVGVVAVFVAAMMNPPFSGARPWAVFAVVAGLAAAGVTLCDRAVGGARLPALRRLDSLMLTAPVWVISLAVIGQRW